MLTTPAYQEINTPFQKQNRTISYKSNLGTTPPFKGGAWVSVWGGGCLSVIANYLKLLLSNPSRREGMKVWRGGVGQAGRSFQTFLAFLLRFFVKKKMKAKNGYGKQTEFIQEGVYQSIAFYNQDSLNPLSK